jgi:hypothetical protein
MTPSYRQKRSKIKPGRAGENTPISMAGSGALNLLNNLHARVFARSSPESGQGTALSNPVS